MGMIVIFALAALALLGGSVVIVGLAATLVFHTIGVFFGLTFFLLVTCIFCGSIAWAWRDARARGKPGWAAALLVALAFWPAGLLLWILFRPDKIRKPSVAKSAPPPVSSPPVIN